MGLAKTLKRQRIIVYLRILFNSIGSGDLWVFQKDKAVVMKEDEVMERVSNVTLLR